MKKKTIIGIVVAIVVIFLGLFITKWYQETQVEALETIEMSLCKFNASDIVQIDFNENGTQTFIKKEDKWINAAQPDVLYNQGLMNNVAYQISKLTSYKIIKNVQDPTVYGINENSKIITAYNTINEVSTYRIGQKLPEENATYVWSDENETLALVLDINLASVMVPTNKMIEPLVQIPVYDQMNQLTITKQDQIVMQMERIDQVWQMNAPFQNTHEVLEGQIESYVGLLGEVKKDKVVENPNKDLETYGLTQPSLSIAINEDYIIDFGNKENGHIYFKTNKDSGIYEVKEENINKLYEVDPFSWITKTLYKPDRKTLKEITVEYTDKTYHLQLKEALDVPSLNGHLIDGSTKETILSGFEGLMIHSYLSNTSFEENNPRPAEITISYTDLSNQVMKLEFVPYDPSFYLLRMDDHIEFSVEKKVLVDFMHTLDNLLQSYTKQ